MHWHTELNWTEWVIWCANFGGIAWENHALMCIKVVENVSGPVPVPVCVCVCVWMREHINGVDISLSWWWCSFRLPHRHLIQFFHTAIKISCRLCSIWSIKCRCLGADPFTNMNVAQSTHTHTHRNGRRRRLKRMRLFPQWIAFAVLVFIKTYKSG